MAVNPYNYNNLCSVIYRQLYEKLERRDEESLRFATRGTSKEVLHDDNLRSFFRSLDWPTSSADEQSHIDEKDFIGRIKTKDLYDFLAILIFATCSIDAAKAFVTIFVVNDPETTGHSVTLPVGRYKLVELFGDVDADRFSGKQACFCAVVLRDREETKVESHQRLPYLEVSPPLGVGSVGKVFKVKIAKGHFSYHDPDDSSVKYNTESMLVARKDYDVTSLFSGRHEHDIMQKINSMRVRCDNIARNFGSFDISATKYSLFMPLATCDLQAYMTDVSRNKPAGIEAKAEIIRCAMGLACGLDFLHRGMKGETMNLVCYHMDLKPENILIFKERFEGKIRHIWKLSDFGMSRVRRSGQGEYSDTDVSRWFFPRQNPQDPSPSLTLNRRAEGIYLAPESIRSGAHMGTASDVWSLGCVISVVFAYLEDGDIGISSYEEARGKHRNAEGQRARFFLRGRFFETAAGFHPEVKRWHKLLVDRAMQRSTKEGETVKSLTMHLERFVFEIEPTARCEAHDVERMLGNVYKGYKELGAADSTIQAPNPSAIPSRELSQATSAERDVEEWYVSSSEAFKGCVISSDAGLVAYWSDARIVVFSSDALVRRGNKAAPSAVSPDGQVDSIWQSVSLTQKWVVACAANSNICYIYDLSIGLTVDVILDQLNKVKLPVPEIHKVAISPNSRWLAFIHRHNEDPRGPASLIYVGIRDLLGWSARADSTSDDRTRRPDTATARPPWNVLLLKWPATDVMHLSISNTRECHVVIRPELRVRNHEPKIPIIWASHENKTLDTLELIPRGFDSSGTVGFLTTFYPFRTEPPTCAVVTHQKRLHIQTLNGRDPSRDLQTDIPNHRVLKLMVSWDDDKIYFLGTTSASHKIQLFWMPVPEPRKPVHVERLASLPNLSYNDGFVATLSDKGDKKYVLVASLAGTRRRTIYRIRLPSAGSTS